MDRLQLAEHLATGLDTDEDLHPDPLLGLGQPLSGGCKRPGAESAYLEAGPADEDWTGFPASVDGQELVLVWTSPPPDPDLGYRFLVRLGVTQFGWMSAWVGEGGFTELDPTEVFTWASL